MSEESGDIMLLECNDVIKIYYDPVSDVKVAALRGIDLSVTEGELIALIGTSGSGKSTLINLIGGNDRPSSGDISVNGNLLNQMSERQLTEYRRKNIGFLFQLPQRNLIWDLTAMRNVMVPMKLNDSIPLSEQKRRAKELLTKVGLEKRGHHKPSQLSGGEAQRTGIAVALANDPHLILADEPTGELDSVTTFKIIELFKELNQDLGKTIIVVTHDHRFANMTNRALRILDGRIIGLHRAVDPSESMLKREELIYVDNHGNFRIPDKLRSQVGIKNHITLEVVDGKLMIIPVKEE